jgi:hypothetical protein
MSVVRHIGLEKVGQASWPVAFDNRLDRPGGLSYFFFRLRRGLQRSSACPEPPAQLGFFCLCSMLGIEHTSYHSLVDPKPARQLGVVDLLVAHCQVERQFRRKPKRHLHQALTTLRS